MLCFHSFSGHPVRTQRNREGHTGSVNFCTAVRRETSQDHPSNFGAAMNMRATTDPGPFIQRLTNPVPLKVPAVVWGEKNEDRVRCAYESFCGVKVGRSVLVIDLAAPFLGCSPDGVMPDSVVEIKGLYAAHRRQVSPVSLTGPSSVTVP